MRNLLMASVLLLGSIGFPPASGCLWAQTAEAADPPEEEEDATLTEWREILLYGIDEEVLKVIGQIQSSGAHSLDQELLRVFGESVNTAVRRMILGIFQEEQDPAAEAAALALLDDYEEQQRELNTALIGYLVAVECRECLPLLREIVDYEELTVATQAIKGLGRLGRLDAAEEEPVDLFLLSRLDDDDFESRLKPDILLALGELESIAAVDRLIEIVGDGELEKGWRMYAAEALGSIGDTRAVPALEKLFEEGDALLKAYAASAISHFPTEDVLPLLMQGLKDSNWRVRLTAAKGLASPGFSEAVPILMYKARKDPVEAVRLEAVRALGEIGDGEGFELLRGLYADDRQSVEVRSACLDVILEKDLAASVGVLRGVVEENIDKPIFKSRIMEYTGRKLAEAESTAVKSLLLLLLQAANPLVRISGIRGIALNRFESSRQQLETMAENDPHPGVRKEAASALEKW